MASAELKIDPTNTLGAAEIDSGFGDGCADHFNALQVACSDPQIFSELQRAVATFKRSGPAHSHRIKSHQGGSHCVGGYGVCARHQHSGVYRATAADPRPLPARYRVDAVNDGEMDGARMHK